MLFWESLTGDITRQRETGDPNHNIIVSVAHISFVRLRIEAGAASALHRDMVISHHWNDCVRTETPYNNAPVRGI